MNAAFARHLPPRRLPGRQRGISMFIVMIVLMLALILVLGGLSVTNLNESLVGNQSDAQRAYSSAQALLDAAQRDIRLNGKDCDAPAMGSPGKHLDFPATGITTDCTLRFPRDMTDYEEMASGTPGLGNCGSEIIPNLAGVCISGDPANAKFASDTVNNGDEDVNAQQWGKGATYTQFVAKLDKADANGIAYGGDAKAGGTAMTTPMNNSRYWIEVFPYNVNSDALGSGIGNKPTVEYSSPFVYRITALAHGLKGDSTRSLLRTYYYIPLPP